MGDAQKGFVLPFTLIVNTVILSLVLANAKAYLLQTQLLSVYQQQSVTFYELESQLNHITQTLQAGKSIPCLFEALGTNDFFVRFLKNKNRWCFFKHQQVSLYALIERFPTSCIEHVLFNQKKYQFTRYRINLLTISPAMRVQRIIVVRNKQKTCPPESVFVIKDGIETYRWSE